MKFSIFRFCIAKINLVEVQKATKHRMTATHVQQVQRLYKTIMKLHRGLPSELQLLGNNYARDEFKRHKKCTPEEAQVFMNEWSMYALSLAEQLGLRGPRTGKELGSPLSDSDLDKFRAEQLHQLYELKLAASTEKASNADT